MIREINSKDNKRYREWLKLGRRKDRQRTGLYLIEETNLIEEALKNCVEIDSLIVREGCIDNLPEDAFRRCRVRGEDELFCNVLPERLFRELSCTENGRGVMAVVKKRVWTPADFGMNGRSTNLVVLDRLQDPGNTGTIIRTADGAGFGGIVVIRGTCDIYSPKVVRSATGSIFRIPIVFVDDGDEMLKLMKSTGKKILVSCFEDSVNYTDADMSEHTALVIGNEGRGVSEKLIENADVRVRIPMFGNIDSLNASIAAGILMYESVRQRG